jgi:hypothetical protein
MEALGHLWLATPIASRKVIATKAAGFFQWEVLFRCPATARLRLGYGTNIIEATRDALSFAHDCEQCQAASVELP